MLLENNFRTFRHSIISRGHYCHQTITTMHIPSPPPPPLPMVRLENGPSLRGRPLPARRAHGAGPVQTHRRVQGSSARAWSVSRRRARSERSRAGVAL